MKSAQAAAPVVSIIMPCYNAEKYLKISVESIIQQAFTDWELIIVNDGSTDNSENLAKSLAVSDSRISVVSQENGGYVSARLHGYTFASSESRYLLFYDADDKLHPDMLKLLVDEMERNPDVGAAYCDHRIMDEHDNIADSGIDMPRAIPTPFWVKTLDDQVKVTPFISIFCWTKMIEPMTLLRRTAYDATHGWDMSFGKGHGNIGDGVYLFSEIALKWKVHFINKPLYYYRRHSNQISAVTGDKMSMQADKVIAKWHERISEDIFLKRKISAATTFFKYRLAAYQRWHSLPHELRYRPLNAVKLSFKLIYEYFVSLSLLFTYRRIIN